jgi:sigma54-dependent transcription regulator
MEIMSSEVPALSAQVLSDLQRTITTQDASRERLADRIRLIWRGLDRLEKDAQETEPDLDYPELGLALAELSPRRVRLVRELSRLELDLRRGTHATMMEARRRVEEAVRRVAAFEAEVSEMFLRVFWQDLGVGD